MGMKVQLLRYTPDGEKLIASSAKLCYSPVGIEKIEENLNDEEVDRFLNMLMDLGHESPIEHVSFTFGVEGVSRTLTHQLVRHRIASFSQQSQRYVKLAQFDYVVPPSIENNKKAKELFIKAMEEDQRYYNEITDILYSEHFEDFINEGYSEKKARLLAEKSSIEDARYVFPNACETKIVFTMNARSLMNFFKLRCCNRAQWEIRSLAWKMLKEVKEVYPVLFKNAGPSCISGPCSEGNMNCGKMDEVKQRYSSL